jgi:hypothetical protein
MILPTETQQNRQFPTASRISGSQREDSRARNRAQGAALRTVHRGDRQPRSAGYFRRYKIAVTIRPKPAVRFARECPYHAADQAGRSRPTPVRTSGNQESDFDATRPRHEAEPARAEPSGQAERVDKQKNLRVRPRPPARVDEAQQVDRAGLPNVARSG